MKNPVKILLAEDDAVTAMCLKMELIQRGYNVYKIVTNGEDAIRWAEINPPDLILMDIQLMGKMDGIEAASQILSRGERPIIFLSGFEDKETRERAMALKPLSYLTKPASFEILKPIIDSVHTSSV